MATHDEWTGDQVVQILQTMKESGADRKQIQAILSKGYLSDLCLAHIAEMDRDIFRSMLDLPPLRPEFEVWRSITTRLKPGSELDAEIHLAFCFVDPWAQDLLLSPGFVGSHSPGTFNLVRIEVRDLGFKSPLVTNCQIIARAEKLGLRLCPPDLAPQLLLDLKHCLDVDRLWVMMEPICDSHGRQSTFRLERRDNNDHRLAADYAYSGNKKLLKSQLVFQK